MALISGLPPPAPAKKVQLALCSLARSTTEARVDVGEGRMQLQQSKNAISLTKFSFSINCFPRTASRDYFPLVCPGRAGARADQARPAEPSRGAVTVCCGVVCCGGGTALQNSVDGGDRAEQ